MPYEVVEPITHLGRAYAKGAPIALRPHEAYQLMAAGCVREVPPPVPVAPILEQRPLIAGKMAPLSYRVPPAVKAKD